ncbi:MAG: tape measure protein, partial [Candidatus Thorarchaeota archaeon]
MVLGFLPKVGVEAVVAGMAEFSRNVGIFNRAVASMGRSAKEQEEKVGFLSKALNKLGGFLSRVASVALGIIVANVLGRLVRGFLDLAKAAFDAGAEFQFLLIRLEGLIAREMVQTGVTEDMAEALGLAIPVAKELFTWIEMLALQSPFDIMDVANVVTLASSYGFATEEAKELTVAVTNFAAGMGLSNIEMVRIIENLGQMKQQGKITGTELRDLGRGAFLPINRLLEMTAERLGITTEELNDLRSKGLAPMEPFMEAFIEMVGEDFPESGKRASRTIKGVIGNFKDLFQGLLGFEIIRPILDSIAGPLADILDSLTSSEDLIPLARKFGENIAKIVGAIFSLFSDTDDMAENLLDAFFDVNVALQKFTTKFLAAIEDLKAGGTLSEFIRSVFGAPPGEEKNIFDRIADSIAKLEVFFDETLPRLKLAFKKSGLSGVLFELGASPGLVRFGQKLEELGAAIRKFFDEDLP